jgi:hypothetical protein
MGFSKMPKWRMTWEFDGDTEYKPANLGVPFFPDKPVYIYIIIMIIIINNNRLPWPGGGPGRGAGAGGGGG